MKGEVSVDNTQKIVLGLGLSSLIVYLVLTIALIVKYPVAIIFMIAIIIHELNN